jgi:hypothetical protein
MARKPVDVLQVEQLFDDGTHPVIAETLFTDAYGLEPVTTVETPAECDGQLSIGDDQ